MGSGRTPKFGHLPTVLGEGNRRLSKRDKGAGLAEYQTQGYLPEALLNYLALLGWAIAEDRDIFTIEEMVAAFDIRRVNANPARFDAKKCEAINASHIRRLTPPELTEQLVPFLVRRRAGQRPAAARRALPARGGRPAGPGADQHAVRGGRPAGLPVPVRRTDRDRPGRRPDRDLGSRPWMPPQPPSSELPEFDHEAIETALRAALVEGLGLKPRLAFGPVRAAVTGRRISPPLFESLELLGRDSTLARIAAARATLDA